MKLILVYMYYVICYSGEFGIVYKAHYVKQNSTVHTTVAVKTLKGVVLTIVTVSCEKLI